MHDGYPFELELETKAVRIADSVYLTIDSLQFSRTVVPPINKALSFRVDSQAMLFLFCLQVVLNETDCARVSRFL
jgi:hypothetical protein